MVDIQEQIQVVHQVASEYWGHQPEEIREYLGHIEVIKRNGGKIMGILPAFKNHSEAFFKVYFYDRGFNFESRGLRTANAIPQVEGVTVPKLIAIYPEYRTILTKKENLEGNRSGLQRFFVNSLGIDWVKVGRWLRAFHDTQVGYEKNDYFLRKKFEKIESHLSDLQSLFTNQEMNKMRRIIEDAHKYFENENIDWVISHGDFGLANIQKNGDLLEIIDFEDCQIAPRTLDILNCVARLEYTGYFPHMPRNFVAIRKLLWEGYGIKPEQSLANDFLSLSIKLDMIETYHRRKKGNKKFMNMIYLYFEHKNRVMLSSWITKTNKRLIK